MNEQPMFVFIQLAKSKVSLKFASSNIQKASHPTLLLMFPLAVAADIFGNKVNFELSFAARPSLLELTRATEVAFSNEISLRRPENVPMHSFHIAKIKLYDEDRNKWVDLLTEGQLTTGSQLYAFQPENPWHKESPKEIPPAVRPPAPATSVSASSQPLRPSSSTARPTSSQSIVPNAVQHTSATMANYSSSQNVVEQRYVSSSTTSASMTTGYNNRGATTSAAASQPPRSLNVNATEDEKLRIVFAEFDLKNTRMIDMEDLKQGFRTLGLEFTTATMNDLFQKGDLNNDGRISYSEFERFARLYPIMMDCLFFRSKAFWDEENMNREIQAEKESVRQAQLNVQQAQNQVAAALRAVEEANEAIMAAESDIKDRNSRLRDVAKDTDAAQREKERVQKERYDREGELASLRDRERASRQTQQEFTREVEKLDRRAVALQQDSVKCEDRVKALQQQLLEAQRAAERAAQLSKQAITDVENVRIKEREAARATEAVVREIPRVEDSLREADFSVTSAVGRIKELDMLSRDLMREIEEAGRRRDAAERAANASRDQELNLQTELERIRRIAEERDRQAKAREAELIEQQRQRQLITQHERALIEQELRLREQRDSLEEKETKLKSEATTFLGNLRQSMARPSYSRDPSAAAPDYRGTSGAY